MRTSGFTARDRPINHMTKLYLCTGEIDTEILIKNNIMCSYGSINFTSCSDLDLQEGMYNLQKPTEVLAVLLCLLAYRVQVFPVLRH